MCRGRSENTAQEGLSSASESPASCELCGKRAALYCPADKAFLCVGCDRRVHSANFLAFRHVRCILCLACRRITQRYVVGASVEMKLLAAAASAQRRTDAKTNYCKETQKEPTAFLWFCQCPFPVRGASRSLAGNMKLDLSLQEEGEISATPYLVQSRTARGYPVIAELQEMSVKR